MSQQQIIKDPVALRTVKRQVSADLSLVQPRDLKLWSKSDDDDDDDDDGETEQVIAHIPKDLILGPTMEKEKEKEKGKEKSLESKIDQLAKEVAQMRKDRYKTVAGNTAGVFVETLRSRLGEPMDTSKGSISALQSDHSTTRLSAVAAELYAERGKIERKLPMLDSRCLKLLKNFDSLVQSRNTLSHDTDAEFARLLSLPEYSDDQGAELWRKTLEFIHGCSIRELAGQDCELEAAFQ